MHPKIHPGKMTFPFEPPSSGFQVDVTRKLLTLVEDDRSSLPEKPSEIAIELLYIGESQVDSFNCVSGEVARQRAITLKANHCQSLGEIILASENRIPSAWNYYVILLTATLWQSPSGGLYIPCLIRDEGKGWRMGVHWIVGPCSFYRVFLPHIVE